MKRQIGNVIAISLNNNPARNNAQLSHNHPLPDFFRYCTNVHRAAKYRAPHATSGSAAIQSTASVWTGWTANSEAVKSPNIGPANSVASKYTKREPAT